MCKTFFKQTGNMKVAIIGAGCAGLCSARHCLDNGFQVTVYEQTENIGGIWVYTDQTDSRDDYRVHPGVYKGLRFVLFYLNK